MVFVTLGQTPRDDVIPELFKIIGKTSNYREIGLLDDSNNIERAKPSEDEEFLVTRLREGSEVKLSRRWVEKILKRIPHQKEMTVLLCTDDVDIDGYILPSKILKCFASIIKPEKLGIVVPEPGQIEMVRGKWKSIARDLKIVSYSPYTHIFNNLSILRDRDLVILDCIGYTLRDEEFVKKYTEGIVVSARKLLGNFLRSIL